MPKQPRNTKSKRSCPLEKQIAYDKKPWFDKKTSTKQPLCIDSDNKNAPQTLGKKAMQLIREQQQEESQLQARNSTTLNSKSPLSDSSDDDESDDMEDTDSQNENLIRIREGYVEDIELCDEDEQVLSNFMSDLPEQRNLADIIMAKIDQKKTEEQVPTQQQFDPKIIEVYTGVGKILHRYTSGKLPKAFKVIPSLTYWEDILWLTQADQYSPHAMYAATRLFASNLNPKMAQRFFNIFLLEHVRQDIRQHKRLNYHLYMALKKALYKPQAFFKGIILPLCEGGDCTLREAAIIASVLSKVSIPVIHSAAALLKLAKMPYTGSNSIFIRVLLDKKYNLPTRVVTEVCQHFINFKREERVLPVLWHQSLLAFAQRYRNDICKDRKEDMKALLKQHYHHLITPEIRRELFAME